MANGLVGRGWCSFMVVLNLLENSSSDEAQMTDKACGKYRIVSDPSNRGNNQRSRRSHKPVQYYPIFRGESSTYPRNACI